jgi:hypothetical protein
MNVCEVLAKSVRSELNHAYTQRPFQTPHGLDMGWFCREHALHVAALTEMLGGTAHICCGDVIVRVPGTSSTFVISTVGSGSDHAWCRVNDLAPVDASLTLQFFDTGRRDVDVVCPGDTRYLAGFDLQYHVNVPDDVFVSAARTGSPVIAYNEKTVLRFDYADLLAHPFSFLHSMPSGVRSFQQIHGDDVYFAITAHLYDLASEKTRPLSPYRDPKSAVRTMVKRYPDARMRLCTLLGERQSNPAFQPPPLPGRRLNGACQSE